nr:MAG TPA: hypothetical protein [Caudoviricetes sp.]
MSYLSLDYSLRMLLSLPFGLYYYYVVNLKFSYLY